MSTLLAHGMGTDPVAPDWPPLTEAEVEAVVGPAHVLWRSPARSPPPPSSTATDGASS